MSSATNKISKAMSNWNFIRRTGTGNSGQGANPFLANTSPIFSGYDADSCLAQINNWIAAYNSVADGCLFYADSSKIYMYSSDDGTVWGYCGGVYSYQNRAIIYQNDGNFTPKIGDQTPIATEPLPQAAPALVSPPPINEMKPEKTAVATDWPAFRADKPKTMGSGKTAAPFPEVTFTQSQGKVVDSKLEPMRLG